MKGGREKGGKSERERGKGREWKKGCLTSISWSLWPFCFLLGKGEILSASHTGEREGEREGGREGGRVRERERGGGGEREGGRGRVSGREGWRREGRRERGL